VGRREFDMERTLLSRRETTHILVDPSLFDGLLAFLALHSPVYRQTLKAREELDNIHLATRVRIHELAVVDNRATAMDMRRPGARPWYSNSYISTKRRYNQ
jgi:hypothetical protein